MFSTSVSTTTCSLCACRLGLTLMGTASPVCISCSTPNVVMGGQPLRGSIVVGWLRSSCNNSWRSSSAISPIDRSASLMRGSTRAFSTSLIHRSTL
ncbi:hypothetical protein PR003_g35184, partial [Phytophthora rubi]